MTTLPANLPSIAKAKLPATYEGARASLDKCVRIDECQEWADKAAALASYAKQADDDELQKMAERIRARAIRRCGELLKQIASATNKHDVTRSAAGPSKGRFQAGRDAGLSQRQIKDSLGVAGIPEREFEAAVESDDPPTVTRLLEERRPIVDLQGRNPKEYATATQALGIIRRFSEFADHTDPAVIARGASKREQKTLGGQAQSIGAWLKRLLKEIDA